MIQCYSGYLLDKRKLQNVSSGGVITAFSEIVIENGGDVFGAAYSNDYKYVKYVRASTVEDLEQLKGTKYCETRKKNEGKHIFESVEQSLKRGKLVLFIGVGCDVGALKKYCERKEVDTKNLFLIDILCHGPAPALALEKYIELLENRYNSKVVTFNMRKKINGWTPFYIYAEFENGDKYLEPFEKTEFACVFTNVARPACTNCQFKGENHKGDVCVGDCWGINAYMEGWNKDGVSAIIVQTDKGMSLLEMLDERFVYNKISEKFLLDNNAMYLQSRIPKVDYEEFMRNLQEHDLCYAIQKFPKEKTSIRQIIKKMVPTVIVRQIKKIREIENAKKMTTKM